LDLDAAFNAGSPNSVHSPSEFEEEDGDEDRWSEDEDSGIVQESPDDHDVALDPSNVPGTSMPATSNYTSPQSNIQQHAQRRAGSESMRRGLGRDVIRLDVTPPTRRIGTGFLVASGSGVRRLAPVVTHSPIKNPTEPESPDPLDIIDSKSPQVYRRSGLAKSVLRPKDEVGDGDNEAEESQDDEDDDDEAEEPQEHVSEEEVSDIDDPSYVPASDLE